MAFLNEPVLNIIVVGFHHKKGCQVIIDFDIKYEVPLFVMRVPIY